MTHRRIRTTASGSACVAARGQTINAIVFMYREVLRREPGEFGDFQHAKRPKRLPTVLTKAVCGHSTNRIGQPTCRALSCRMRLP